ncbi:hypothetical protein [Winogradskyella tangerina]|uniref:hypothetical protein n=1 Tax=Winogradskyella tangerina TaxID=2023240 RepID=UPI000DBE25B7|nr:hypothetical protein [Winogradskyella tangerina]
MEYLEVEHLKAQYKKYNIKISQGFGELREDTFFVTLTIGSKSWDILIDDEFKDFGKHNAVFDWFMVLYALETYEECEDMLEWSNYYGLEPNNLIDYYKNLATTYREIEGIIGPIDPLISSFNYTLRTGVVDALETIKN